MTTRRTQRSQHRRKPVYWTTERLLKMLRRAAREIYDNDPERLPTRTADYRRDIKPYNEGRNHNYQVYPSYAAICARLGGLQQAWKRLGFDVVVRMYSKPQRHIFTDQIDARLREIYSHPNAKKNAGFRGGIPGVKEYAASLGWPRHALHQRAQELGIARIKEKRWNKTELAALDDLAHFTPATICRKFRERGLKRTENSIAVMRKRRNAHKAAPWYSGNALTTLMGVDGHQIGRVWIPMGLKFTLKGQRSSRQKGDVHLFHKDDIRQFFIDHPEEIDFLKVDKMWFLELITNGVIQAVLPSPRLGKRAEAPRPGARRAYPPARKAA